jgi:Big-like domain-containing protein
VLASGCDEGSRDEQPAHGPALHVIATYPADGQGTATGTDAGVDCDTPTPDCAVPTDVEIQLRFDRFLLPGVGLSSGLRLFTGDPKANSVSLSPEYNLIERVVVFHLAAPLQPNTLYTAEVVAGKDSSKGFWAFDHAPLEEGAVPLSFSFTTGGGPAAPATPAPVTTDNCTTITEGPRPAGMVTLPAGAMNVCGSTCHTNPPDHAITDPTAWTTGYPPMALSLTDWGLAHTAINRVAHETETGNSARDPGLQSSPRFGVQMNVVDPGFPENSYLMYKLLRKPENYALAANEPCPVDFHPPVSDGACAPPDDAELARLREWFVLGDPMPKDLDTQSAISLSRGELERVARWISAGAACDVP